MNYRKIFFVLLDYITGGKIIYHLKHLQNDFRGINKSSNSLKNLLVHAESHVPFYAKFGTIINNYPIINKSIIRSYFDQFQSLNFENKRKVTMTTSGSTGTPFTVYQDINKKRRNYADTLYFGELGGYILGNKLFYIKIWAKQKMSTSWMYKLQNVVPVDALKLNDNKIADLILQMESEKNPISILGYVSALENFIRYSEKFNKKVIAANTTSVITMSEGLNAETKIKLEKLFNCKVVSRYSNLENGIIAQEELGSDLFLVNTASYIVEIFHPTENHLISDGEVGRIVITDLFNYAMPLIRYDTGDFGIKIYQNGKTYLKSIEGRKLDLLFDTSGNLVSSFIMYKNMWQYTEIEQYQLIQIHIKKYEFKINCPSGFKREKQLVNEFKEYLGHDAELKLTYVEEIPLLDSGKRRKTVNLFYK